MFFRVWGPTLMARNVLHQPKSIYVSHLISGAGFQVSVPSCFLDVDASQCLCFLEALKQDKITQKQQGNP